MNDAFPSPAVGLDDLLAGIARGLVRAQGELDAAARTPHETTAATEAGEVHLRPLWFVFQRTTIDLELSTFTASATEEGAAFRCKPLDPVALALRGDARALGAKLHIELAPHGADILDEVKR